VYLRYNSFHNSDDFKKEVLRLNPSRFEIGPQYSARVSATPSTALTCSREIERHLRQEPCSLSGENWSLIST
jgi:hypothetical protein